MNMSKTKRSVRSVREAAVRISDLYGEGSTGRLMQGKWGESKKVQGLIRERHRRYGKYIDADGYFNASNGDTWKVPYGVRLCLRRSLVSGQITVQYPWAVTWKSPRTGKRARKHFATPYGAFDFIATTAQYVDSRAAIISRGVGYDIPARLRGIIPHPWKWCPRCMTARRFKVVYPEQHFYALRKEWNSEKQRYDWNERKLRILQCELCGCTNRDSKMRRSNQPFEVRRIKQGVRRVRKHRRRKPQR